MSSDTATPAQLEELINSHKVVVFMKGSRDAPQCGSSSGITRLLDLLLEDYAAVNVAGESDLADAVKVFTGWPKIPLLFVDGQFIGDLDVAREMHAAGELRPLLGLPPLSVAGTPNITITDAAAKLIREVIGSDADRDLCLEIDAQIRHSLSLNNSDQGLIRCVVNGISLCLDPESAARADGLVIETDPSGKSIRTQNPNKPQPASASPEPA